MKAATGKSDRKSGKGVISIHAAREGGDMMYLDENGNEIISIHAAREGGDRKRTK